MGTQASAGLNMSGLSKPINDLWSGVRQKSNKSKLDWEMIEVLDTEEEVMFEMKAFFKRIRTKAQKCVKSVSDYVRVNRIELERNGVKRHGKWCRLKKLFHKKTNKIVVSAEVHQTDDQNKANQNQIQIIKVNNLNEETVLVCKTTFPPLRDGLKFSISREESIRRAVYWTGSRILIDFTKHISDKELIQFVKSKEMLVNVFSKNIVNQFQKYSKIDSQIIVKKCGKRLKSHLYIDESESNVTDKPILLERKPQNTLTISEERKHFYPDFGRFSVCFTNPLKTTRLGILDNFMNEIKDNKRSHQLIPDFGNLSVLKFRKNSEIDSINYNLSQLLLPKNKLI